MTERVRSDAIAGVITGASVSYRGSDVATIEEVTAEHPQETVATVRKRDGVKGAFVLQTCNRAERYVVTPSPERGRAILSEWLEAVPAESRRMFDHDGAIEHLIRVAAGLESMVVGEDEILGQVRRAREAAERADALDPLLEEVTAKALQVGKRVRTETAINEGTRSISRAAVDHAADRAGLSGSTVAVIGTGEMGERIARACPDYGVAELVLLNRTPERARALAGELPATAEGRSLEALDSALEQADVVFAATASPAPIVEAYLARGAAPLLVVDIGQPRDVTADVGTEPGVELVDLDDLQSVLETTADARAAAAAAVEAIVEAERERLAAQLKRRQADHAIAAMYEQAERLKERELSEARAKLAAHHDLDEDERAILEGLADAIVGSLMAAPTKSLREAAEEDDWATIQTALGLFDPEFATGAVGPDDADTRPPSSVPSEHESS